MNELAKEYLHILFKRGRFIILAFVLIAGPVIVFALLRPSVYRAAGKLILVGNRSYLQLAPQDSKRIVQVPDLQAIAAEQENLRNKSFLLSAAHNLQIDILNNPPKDREARDRATAGAIFGALEITPFPSSPMIEVAFSHTDRNKAAAVVNTLLDTYMEYHPYLSESPDIADFYSRHEARLQRDVSKAEHRLERFQRRTGIISLQQQKDETVRQMMASELSLRDTTAQIHQTEELTTALEKGIQTQPDKIAGDVDMVDNPVVIALQERIGLLTVELSDLQQKYTDENRLVKDKKAQIEELQRRVADQAPRIIGTERFAVNQIRQNIEEELVRARANHDALVAKQTTLQKTVDEYGGRLTRINARGYRLQQLDDDVQNKRAALQNYFKRSEEAKLSESMNKAKLDSIRIADRAVPPSMPYNERTWLAIIIGIVGGLSIGLAGAFGLEFLYQTYHFGTDIERELELPVLGLISDIPTT